MAFAAPVMPFLKIAGTVLSVAQGARSLFAKPPKQQPPPQIAALAPSLVAPEQKKKKVMAAYSSLQSDDRNFANRTTTFGLGG